MIKKRVDFRGKKFFSFAVQWGYPWGVVRVKLMREVYEAVDFEVAVGLPITFADIGLEGITADRLKSIGDVCASEGSLCGSHCFPVTSEAVVDAMIAADALGTDRKEKAGIL